MTWGEIKVETERRGVRDSDRVAFINLDRFDLGVRVTTFESGAVGVEGASVAARARSDSRSRPVYAGPEYEESGSDQ